MFISSIRTMAMNGALLLLLSLAFSSVASSPCLADPLSGERKQACEEAAKAMRDACPPIAYIERDNYGMNGTNAVMFAHRTGRGAKIRVFDPINPDVEPTAIFETTDGFIFDMDASYDGRRLVFSYKTHVDQPFHLWEINTDGTGLRQLTDGRYHDFSPTYYPDGRIVFCSSRVESYSLCQNYLACALYVIGPDGEDMRRIDYTTLCSISPSVMSDGSILCTRWEYQDKNIFGWEGLWTIRPDGRNLRLYHGNTFRVPNAVYGGRQIPETNLVIVVWAAHHRVPIGDLAIVDRSKGVEAFDSMWKITHVTPIKKDLADEDNWRATGIGTPEADALFPEAFTDPYPVTKDFSVVSFGGDGPRHNLYLLHHETGETALLHSVENAGCFNAVPLAPRAKPPALPGDCPQEAGEGTFFVQDVYRGLGEKGVERGQVKALRIMSQSPKKYNTEGPRYHDHYPVVGHGSYYVKHNHGTVPVDENGSAYFKAPSNTELYFIALDERGKEIQRMGSVTQITTGELVSCVGCHEDRLSSPPVSPSALAGLKRPPSEITPPAWGAGAVDFVTQVQPILDKYCVECHGGATPDAKIDLSGDKTRFYNMGYQSLVFPGYVDYYYINHGPNGNFPAMATGSWVSRLTKLIEEKHADVDMDDTSRRCIYAWIDANVPYYSVWDITRPHATGGRDGYATVTLKPNADLANPNRGNVAVHYGSWIGRYNALWKRLAPEKNIAIQNNGGNTFDPACRINLTNPQWSPVITHHLAKSAGGLAEDDDALFPSKDDPNYVELLEILKEASDAFNSQPRIDMPGAKPIAQELDFGRTF